MLGSTSSHASVFLSRDLSITDSGNARFVSTSFKPADRQERTSSTHSFAFDEDGETARSPPSESISFPATSGRNPSAVENQPILLNAKEHAVGYLSRILNARVYEAAIETELQHAKNLSAVSAATMVMTYFVPTLVFCIDLSYSLRLFVHSVALFSVGRLRMLLR
jgi:hypothetical protein